MAKVRVAIYKICDADPDLLYINPESLAVVVHQGTIDGSNAFWIESVATKIVERTRSPRC